MRLITTAFCIAVICCFAQGVRAQALAATAGPEQRVSLEESPMAFDAQGKPALSGQLLTKAMAGSPDAPVKNARFVIENRSASFYKYVAGSVTFYDERGVRCGEGLFTMSALAPGEQAETDAPGLRVSCAPRSWRLVASNLITRSEEQAPTAEKAEQPAPVTAPEMRPIELVVDDKVYSAPIGSTLEIPVRRRMVKITVRSGP